jgi:Flp pilus assembly secretin CpaC
MMVKAAISVLAMAALQFFAAEPALKIGQHLGNMRIVSSDANARQLKLGYKKAVVIDLPIDIREVLVADPGTVTVIMRTTRRVYITGVALGKTNIFFFDDDGRQIFALALWGSGFITSSVATALIVLARDRIPDFWSIVVGNALLV